MHRTRGFGIKVLHTPVSVDVNECLKNNGGCHSKRKCANTPGSRTCGNCPSGYTNDGATGCKGLCVGLVIDLFGCLRIGIDLQGCSMCTLAIMKHRYPRTTSFLDVNECLVKNGGCYSKRQCTNTPGSRTCGNCPGGWTNDGATSCKGAFVNG